MAEKLSWTELRKALATRAGVSEKQAGAFLNALQAQLVAALKSDKQVKINGLGTFKLQSVAPRKSVNVATGEEITIEGYNKLAFTPEAGVKELVESGTLTVESSPEIDPIQKLGAQADEIVDILGDLGQSPKDEPVEEPAPVVEPEPIVEPEPAPVYFPGAAPEPEPEIIIQRPKEKKSHFLRDTLICLIIILALLAVCYFFFRQQLSDIITSFMQPAQTEVVAPEAVASDTLAVEAIDEPAQEDLEDPETALIPDGRIPKQQILEEFLAASGEIKNSTENKGAEKKVADTKPLEIKGTEAYPVLITVEDMHEGSRLTWMSKRYYGRKVYWPYLYDANRDHIVNPNDIEVGTPIRVPKLSMAQCDTTSAEFLRLKAEAEAACK